MDFNFCHPSCKITLQLQWYSPAASHDFTPEPHQYTMRLFLWHPRSSFSQLCLKHRKCELSGSRLSQDRVETTARTHSPPFFFFLNSYSRRSPILWDNKLVISTLTQDVGNQGSFWTIRKGKISLAWSQGNWVTSVIWQGENRLKRDRQTDLHCIMREYFQIRQGRIKVITQATSITPAE